MKKVLDPFRFLLIAVAVWMNQAQQQMIEYLREENRVLREQLGESPKSWWFSSANTLFSTIRSLDQGIHALQVH